MKIAILGDSGVGKTTLLNRCYGTEPVKIPDIYRPTIDPETRIIEGTEIIEYGGQNIIQTRLEKADLYVIMFSRDSKLSYMELNNFYKLIKSIDNEPDIIICGISKGVDKIKNRDITFHRKYNLEYCNDENFIYLIGAKVLRFMAKGPSKM